MIEKSCGAIVYKKENEELLFLLVHQSNGIYGFPKGHMEPGESEIDTAIREIKEETNLEINIDINFRKEISYLMQSKNITKVAVYFVGTPKSHDLKNQEGEITECFWLKEDEVKEKLGFENIIEVFNQACSYIKKEI